MSEIQWERWVVRVAALYGWHGFHVRQSEGNVQGIQRADAYGWPDWVFVRGEVLYRELKTEVGRLTAAQKLWIATLGEAGANVKVWRPSMWQEVIDTFSHH